MRNVHEVLRDKELRLVQVRQEVEALRLVAAMLLDRSDVPRSEAAPPEPSPQNRWPLQVDGLHVDGPQGGASRQMPAG